jgi:hypothetical protein
MIAKAMRGLWNVYFHSAIPADADPQQIEYARGAFYGGIRSFADHLQQLIESGDTASALAAIRKATHIALPT